MQTPILKLLCAGVYTLKRQRGNEESITPHLPPNSKIQDLICKTHQFSPALFSLSTSSSCACPGRRIWLSKSFYSLGNLYNPPTQINTEETRKWPLVSLAPDNTKYLKLEQWELMRKYKSMAEAFPLVIKTNPFILLASHTSNWIFRLK